MSIGKEFKEFISRGSVVDLAVGVIIGASFGKIVSSLVDDIIMPIIGQIIGGINFVNLKVVLNDAVKESDKVITPEVAIRYGQFIQITLEFLIIAFVIFMMVKGINKMSRNKLTEPEVAPAPTAEESLLMEIRDELRKK
ncbi:MAG: large-conductance mechanosensitive channel protein MscL [Bacteroidota bacterium]|nr:large-conductance mechanosensitive channel protein MscL [Bacteroidota bacterium]